MSNTCGSIKELYDNTKADLVVISVPELSVKEVCFEAFKYDWSCLIEKPAGYNLEDAESIHLEAKRLNRKVYVAFNRRQYSSTKVALEDLAKNSGHRLIHVLDQEDIITARNSGQPELVLSNWMFANSIHLIDYFRVFGRGEIVAVEPVIKWNPDDPSFLVSKISFSSGDIGIYEAIWNAPGPWTVTITTKEKRWELRPLEKASFQLYGIRHLESTPAHDWDINFKPGLRSQAEEAVKAITGRRHTLPTIEDALESMRLVNTIYFGI
jgi:predicted dehydrogenase